MDSTKQVVARGYGYRGEIIYAINSGQAVIFIEPDRPVYFLNCGEAEWFVQARERYMAQVETMISTGSIQRLVGHVGTQLLVPSVTG